MWSSAITLFVRGNWYGDYKIMDNRSDRVQEFGSVLQVDASLGWNSQSGRYSLTFGGNNIFNEQPDPIEFGGCCGLIVSRGSVQDWQGPFYYLRGSLRWD
jgi:outer membrane receptor protein involved in Fe transport